MFLRQLRRLGTGRRDEQLFLLFGHQLRLLRGWWKLVVRRIRISLCFTGCSPFDTVQGSLSDVLGLRLSLPLQSRPAQISEGTLDSTERLEL
jgi:hypothetical protein